MDEIVLRGMARWPNVPAVYGWLALDRRGAWRLTGDVISNPAVTAFIGRNYEHDSAGRWFFQNGPQRVFVALDYTPMVYRIAGDSAAPLAFETHAGKQASCVSGAWMDENGALLLETEHGIGLLHDRDLEPLCRHLVDVHGTPPDESALEGLLDQLQQGREAPLWLRLGDASIRIGPIRSSDVPCRFGFVAKPAAPAGETTCP